MLIMLVMSVLIASIVADVGFGKRDTLFCKAAGYGMALLYSGGKEVKGDEGGFVRAGYRHGFSDEIYARIGLRAVRGFETPMIEDCYAAWQRSAITVRAGHIYNAGGVLRYYRRGIATMPWFMNPLLYESYGFGAGVDWGSVAGRISGTILLNQRENGSAYITWQSASGVFTPALFLGYEICTIRNQDNMANGGGGIHFTFGNLCGQICAAYRYFFGYGHSTNQTMEPGYETMFAGELQMRLFRPLTVSVMGLHNRFSTLFSESVNSAGIEIEILPLRWGGCTGVFEWNERQQVSTMTQELMALVKHPAAGIRFQAGWRRLHTGDSAPVNAVAGYLWLEL